MVSESPAMMVKKASGIKRSQTNKKTRAEVPKRFQKSEREKLKREELNELFLKLANVLEVTEQNNGKASILCETTRLLKDLFDQIECLKKEHASLLSESHYVTIEKDELKEEKSGLETEVEKLKEEVESRVTKSKPEKPEMLPEFATDGFSLPASDATLQQGAAVFVLPVHHELSSFQVPSCAEVASRSSSIISKPHARYPTPADSWPSQLLDRQPTSS